MEKTYSQAWFKEANSTSDVAEGLKGETSETSTHSSVMSTAYHIECETEGAVSFEEASQLLNEGAVIQIVTAV